MSMKRKSNLEHSSRIAYAAEEATNNAAAWSSGPPPPSWSRGKEASFARADPSTLASRRIVRPSGGEDVRSRKHRRQAYLRGISNLNKEFAEWGVEARAQLESTPAPTVDDTETVPLFFLKASEEYLRRAAALRERYCLTHGDVLTFGNGDMGQLGIADKDGDALTEAIKPRLVLNLRNRKIVDLALGGLHSVAVQEDGEVYTWGGNDEGQLGQYRFANPEGVSPPIGFPNFVEQVSTAVVPAKVTGFYPSKSSATYPHDHVPGTDEAIVMAASGDCHTICLSTSGNVYFFGCYKDGDNKSWRDPLPSDEIRGDKERTIEDAYVAKYIRDNDTPDRNVMKEGTIQDEADKKRNEPSPEGLQPWPNHVFRLPRPATFIDAGAAFNAALLNDGTIVTWGTGICGELGRPVREMRNKKNGTYDIDAVVNEHMRPASPLFESPSIKRTVESLACGGWHLLVVAQGCDTDVPGGDLSVYSTGLNNYGQLGLGDNENRSVLTRIPALDGFNISRVAAGYHNTLVLDGTGRELYAFGRADSGQLGYTDYQPPAGQYESLPVRVLLEYDGTAEGESEQPQVQNIACGDNHSLVLTEGGELYTWGYGDTAALGYDVKVDQYRPKKVDFRSKKERDGTVPPPIVRRVAGGGQFSAIVVTRSEQ